MSVFYTVTAPTIPFSRGYAKNPRLSLGMAIRLMEYRIRRNEIAMKSHTKTWMAKHPKANYLLL